MAAILIVEDDPHQAEAIKLRLVDIGYQIAAVVSDGEAAIEQALKLSPDMVLMDIVLPGGIDGIEAAQKIRESCDIPVLYLTAYDNDEFLRRAKVTEPYAYLLKPGTSREFQLAIEIALYRHKAERAAKEALEKAIKERTVKLEQAQSIAHIGSWDVDLSTGQVTWTDELYRIYGVSPETFTPNVENLINLIHTDDRPAMRAWIGACATGLKPKALEFRCVWPDGSIHYIEGQGELLFDADGKPSYISGTAQNITERKQVETELRIAAVAFESQEAILITDVNSNIVRVNRAFTEITGYSAEEVLGKNPRIMQSGKQDRSFYIKMWNQLLHTGTWSGEIWDKRKNGEIYPKWISITAVLNPQHEPTHYVAIFSDITERKRIEAEIHNLAYYDLLTGLPNRRLLLDRMQSALSASSRRNDHGAILFIDLDRFKILNDTLGHEYGDLLLIEVGNRIKACVREMDTVARYGGDEFVVLIEAISSDRGDTVHKVSLVAEKIRAALAEPYNLNEHLHHCSPSIGVIIFHGHGECIEKLLEHADMAMYQVKNGGRNAVGFFDPIMQQKVIERETLKSDLYHALEMQQLRLHYQIQVDRNNQPIGAEAFLRWIHPERGTLKPGQFLHIAEEIKLIFDIDRWVIKVACGQLAAWSRDSKTCDLKLTVHISADYFNTTDFIKELTEILSISQPRPERLKFELPEKIVLNDANNLLEKIQALRQLGVKVSIDNLATMYSSISFIKQLSQDQLKVHREFVQGISTVGSDEELIRSVVNLAKFLGLDVIAEGIETDVQFDFLENQNCDVYQGYLFGKPVPIEEFEATINKE